jgi:hypothetical protein
VPARARAGGAPARRGAGRGARGEAAARRSGRGAARSVRAEQAARPGRVGACAERCHTRRDARQLRPALPRAARARTSDAAPPSRGEAMASRLRAAARAASARGLRRACNVLPCTHNTQTGVRR